MACSFFCAGAVIVAAAGPGTPAVTALNVAGAAVQAGKGAVSAAAAGAGAGGAVLSVAAAGAGALQLTMVVTGTVMTGRVTPVRSPDLLLMMTGQTATGTDLNSHRDAGIEIV